MATFSPPHVFDVPRVPPDTGDSVRVAMQHYSPLPRGVSLLKNQDGSYTLVDGPTGLQMDAAAYTYLGGHIYDITDDEAAALIAAGYGDGVSGYGGMSSVTIDGLSGSIDSLVGTINGL